MQSISMPINKDFNFKIKKLYFEIFALAKSRYFTNIEICKIFNLL